MVKIHRGAVGEGGYRLNKPRCCFQLLCNSLSSDEEKKQVMDKITREELCSKGCTTECAREKAKQAQIAAHSAPKEEKNGG